MIRLLAIILCLQVSSVVTWGHDPWIEAHTSLIRTGDAIYLQLKLGNHGNEHRDFKLAGKLNPADCKLVVLAPDGSSYDVGPDLADLGYAPKEGYFSAKFVPARPGTYVAALTMDKIVNHGRPVRAVRSGKTCFGVSDSLDKVELAPDAVLRPLGHSLELVPVVSPVWPMGPGRRIEVQLLFNGKPLPDAVVSFIPRHDELTAEFDSRYERTTNQDGRAGFLPKSGDQYLVVCHHHTNEQGEGFGETAYTATLNVFVPQWCSCCGAD